MPKSIHLLKALLLLAFGLFAQTNTEIRFVTVAPSGACPNRVQPRILVPNGTFYTCQANIWAVSGGGGGATIPNTMNIIVGDGAGNGANSKVAITSPATAASLIFGTDNVNITFQGTDTYIGRTTTDTLTNKTLTNPNLGVAPSSLSIALANEGVTGTTLNKLAKPTGAPSTAVLLATTDTDGAIGIVVSGAGTAGNAIIGRTGTAACVFDGATTAGDYVQISSTVAGDCHDTGAATRPTSGQIIGRVLSTNGAGGTYNVTISGMGIAGVPGGTVTSVSFTGGLISVANSTTTPAFTVAGTSGGIPYFNAASTWASSAAGVAGAMMSWGGAGAAPTSPLSLLVANQNSATETWAFNNTTAVTGKTKVTMQQGAGVAFGDVLLGLYDNTPTLQTGFERAATGSDPSFVTNVPAYFGYALGSSIGSGTTGTMMVSPPTSVVRLASGIYFGWSSTAAPASCCDVNFSRGAAGLVDVGANSGQNCSTAANCRDLRFRVRVGSGSAPGISGCTAGTQLGGNTVGSYASGTTGACTVTLTFAYTAPNGYACKANDLTTPADVQNQTSTTTTTAVISGTTVTGDVINFSCEAY